MSNTPYDDVFRTMLNDCRNLIIPLINEMFGEHYSGNERIEFMANEHFLNQQDGDEEKRITDTTFVIIGAKKKRYHLECQSTADDSMLIRIFEYDSQIALDEGEVLGYVLTVEFPHSAVLYLRHNENTPDTLTIRIKTPGGEVSYDVAVMKTQKYTLEEIFAKKLFFLIPFYIFTHESRFLVYNSDGESLEALKGEYEVIKQKLEELQDSGEITEYTKCTIIDMSKKVIEHIAVGYENVREGVEEIMGGKVLDYEAKDILNQGKREGAVEIATNMIRVGKMSYEEIATYTGLTLDEVARIAGGSGAVVPA